MWCGPVSLLVAINAIGGALQLKYRAMQDTCSYKDTEKYVTGLMQDLDLSLKEPVKLTEFEFEELPQLQGYFKKIDINKNGLTLQELAHTGDLLGFGTKHYYALGEINSTNLAPKGSDRLTDASQFRGLLKSNLLKPASALIVNFDLKVVGYDDPEVGGHFSPLAAYNELEDMVLIADVWPYTPIAWVPTEKLFQAMQELDTLAGPAPRGVLKIYELDR